MQATHKIPRLPQHKQVQLSELLKPLCGEDDPRYNALRLRTAEQVKAEVEAVIERLTADRRASERQEPPRPTVVGVLKTTDRRFLVFTSTHQAALDTAHLPLTLDPAQNGNQLVRSWNSFVEEQVTGVPCKHFIPADQRALYAAIFSSGQAPTLEVVERGDLTRVERSKARQRYAAALTADGWTLGSEHWN